jgi:hypothetical protein
MLTYSAEIRWFLRGAEQWNALLEWFTREGDLSTVVDQPELTLPDTQACVLQEETRVDDYLLLPECSTVGVKQRQGKLEVKALVAGPRPLSTAQIGGRVDQWLKWSFEPTEPQKLAKELDLAGPWREIAKERFLQKYALDSGSPAAISPKSRPQIGCNVELTRLDADAKSRKWITLGFESFGGSTQLSAGLAAAVETFFDAHKPPPVSLDGWDSLSYPAWLATLE